MLDSRGPRGQPDTGAPISTLLSAALIAWSQAASANPSLAPPLAAGPPGASREPAPIDVLAAELARATASLAGRAEPVHYAALGVEDRDEVAVTATAGTVFRDEANRERWLDVDLRVGSPEVDSTHELRGVSDFASRRGVSGYLPFDDGAIGEAALRRAVWQAVDTAYRDGAEAIVRVRSNLAVKVEEEDPAPDFEPRPGAVVNDVRPPGGLAWDHDGWVRRLAAVSKVLDAPAWVEYGQLAITGARVVKTFVDTEGARAVHGVVHWRVGLHVRTTAADGDQVSVDRMFEAFTSEGLPGEAALRKACEAAVERLDRIRAAPRGTPYSGPVLLEGRAAAVFFHEVLGHRAEGHRLKRDDEGKTFAEYVGRRILPDWLDVADDPTLARVGRTDLLGRYDYDDEGVAAERAVIVDDGVLRGFLLGRSPVPGQATSNGHGRRGAGEAPKSRMGNLIVETSRGEAELRRRLVDEVRAQGLEYGVIVEEIGGGFTSTGRVEPNAFNVRADVCWRVFVDGRPDELIRGVDLVGTPLTAFGDLVAAGDKPEVFNGACGAESGWVPVSAVSPAMLFRRLEFQLKEKASARPPLLGKPGAGRARR